jgi:dTMP kinase
MLKKGKLIVFEGTDGSGKKTQSQLLKGYLERENLRVAVFGFPRYGEPSAKWVEQYLNNELGRAVDIDPYLASIFYSIDRRDNRDKIKKLLTENDIVIMDRYTDANSGHQGGKIRDLEERKKYVDWLYETEYVFFGIPRPDLVIIPHVSSKVAQINVGKKEKRDYLKEGTHDAHEDSLDHLKNAEEAFAWLAREYPENHILIECMINSNLLSLETVHQKVLEVLKEKQLI